LFYTALFDVKTGIKGLLLKRIVSQVPILVFKYQKGELMKMRIILIAVFVTLLAISSPVSAVVPDLQRGDAYDQPDSSETSYTSSLSTVSKSNFSLTDSSRI
jgi:hypothetical protein